VSRLPIRLRVTAAFALAMAAVLAGSGLYLYVRLGSHLALSIDRELQLRHRFVYIASDDGKLYAYTLKSHHA
jgi:hypothetical protein